VNKPLNSRPEGTWQHIPLAGGLLLLAAGLLPSAAHAQLTCPNLLPYYPADAQQWPAAAAQLNPLMALCLQSPEYFALLGAAELNSGNLPAALEALERALLLDPDNGAALVDYAEALYLAGQLFPALEMNTALLQRSDLPVSLQTMLQQRQQSWQAQTSSRGLQVEVDAGYDNNLNGAPARSDFTLTLSGEQIVLTLDPEFRPVSGPYANLRLAGFYRKQSPERSHDLVFALRNRRSGHHESELLQADWRYALTLHGRRHHWDLVAGTSHLLYGGSPLYSVSEARLRYRTQRQGCRPQYELATQHQLYHGQNVMTGLEASATAGLECGLGANGQLLAIDAGPLRNFANKEERPGADRAGWTLRLQWQVPVGPGQVNTQFNYARLADSRGYSELLAGGARRKVNSRFFRIQYSHPLQPNLALQFNFTHQDQGSNIAPFENRGTAAEVGVSFNF
jgi:tetratricopeptide (TPR) repeat protein